MADAAPVPSPGISSPRTAEPSGSGTTATAAGAAARSGPEVAVTDTSTVEPLQKSGPGPGPGRAGSRRLAGLSQGPNLRRTRRRCAHSHEAVSCVQGNGQPGAGV